MRPAVKSRRAAGLLIGAAVFAVPLAAPSSSWATSAEPAASADGPSQAQWKKLDEVSEKHSALGVFGAEDTSNPVLALPAGTSADERSAVVADLPAGVTVKVKVSRFAEGETERIQDRIVAGQWNKDADKYGINAFYDSTTDKVIVPTDAPDSVTAPLRKLYGDKINVFPARFEQQADRFHDVANFFGGDSITNHWGACTSGYKIRVTNPDDGRTVDMMTTAGHCYLRNELVQGHDGTWMGWIKRTGEADLEAYVGYDYASTIWTGGYATSTSRAAIASLSAMYNGMKVCVSGQTTFNHCGHPVTSTAYAFNWTDHAGHSHHTNSWDGFAYAPGGTNAPLYNNGQYTQEGDSGAPVYVQSHPGSAAITGSHSSLVSWWEGACGCTQRRMIGVKANVVHANWGGSVATTS